MLRFRFYRFVLRLTYKLTDAVGLWALTRTVELARRDVITPEQFLEASNVFLRHYGYQMREVPAGATSAAISAASGFTQPPPAKYEN